MNRSRGNQRTTQAVERKLRRIGIHGPRNAGKTCYLGCLYGFRVAEAVQLTFADDVTIRYLAGVWKEIAQQRNPAATGMALPTNLVVEVGGPASQPPAMIQLCDYAGALMEAAPAQATTLARDLSQGVRGWFGSCHAVLVFLDSSRPDMDQIDALDLLLTELCKPQPGGATLAPPLGLVLTKWDTQGPVSGDAAHEEKRACSYLQSNPVFQQISQKLADGGERVKVIPVSAFGNEARDNRPPPPDQFAPCHLYTPLLWAVKAADAAIMAEAKEAAQKHLNRRRMVFDVPLWSHPDYEAALGAYKAAKRDFAAALGPLSVQIDKEMDAVRLGRWRDRLTVFGGIAAVVVGLFVAFWFMGCNAATNSYNEVVAFRVHHSQPDEADARLENEKSCKSAWWVSLFASTDHSAQILQWAKEDEALATAWAEGSKCETAQEWEKAIDAYRDFAQNFPKSEHLSDIQDKIQTAAATWEKQSFETAQQRAGDFTTNHEWNKATDAYRDFARQFPISNHLPEIQKGIQTAQLGLAQDAADDKSGYEAFQGLAIRDAKTLKEADNAAAAYVNGAWKPKEMIAAVQTWRQWYEKVKEGDDFVVIVESLHVPGDAKIVGAIFGDQYAVHVVINETAFCTGPNAGHDPAIQTSLGPYHWKWDDGGKFHVRVEAKGFWDADHFADGEVDVVDFALGKVDDPFVAKDSKGKSVTVKLQCDALRVPTLRPYKKGQ